MKEITDRPPADRKRPGNSRRRGRSSGQYNRTAILYGLIGLALVVVVVYLNIQSEQRKKKLRDQQSITDFESAETSFDQQIARGNVGQLIELSLELADTPDEPLVMRLDRIRKQIAISDRILQLDPDSNSRTLAISTKLKQLMDRAEIIAKQEMYSDVTTAELNQVAAEYGDSEEISVSSLAKTGVAIAAISEFLSVGPSAQRGGLAIEAIEKMKAAAESSPDDPSVATRLHDWLQIIREQCKQEECRLFFAAWSNTYANSSDTRIAKLVDQTGNASDFSEVELVDISDAVRSNRDDVIRQLLEQVDAALNRTEVSTATVLFILQRANELLAFGKLDDAKEIRWKIEQSSTEHSSEEIKRGLAKFDLSLNLFESPFDVSGFTDIHSNPVKFNVANAKFKILYFVSDLNNGETMLKFTKLIETVRSELLNSNLEIVVVYLDREDDPEGLQQIKILAAQNMRWQVWLLKTASDERREFLNRISFDKSPYILFLGKSDRPIALDPTIFGIEEIVFAN